MGFSPVRPSPTNSRCLLFGAAHKLSCDNFLLIQIPFHLLSNIKRDGHVASLFLWRRRWDLRRFAEIVNNFAKLCFAFAVGKYARYHAGVAKGRWLPFVGAEYKLHLTFPAPIPTRSNPIKAHKQKSAIQKDSGFPWRRRWDFRLCDLLRRTVGVYCSVLRTNCLATIFSSFKSHFTYFQT